MKIHLSNTIKQQLPSDIKKELVLLFQSVPQKEDVQLFSISNNQQGHCEITHLLPKSNFLYSITLFSISISTKIKLIMIKVDQDIWMLSDKEYNSTF